MCRGRIGTEVGRLTGSTIVVDKKEELTGEEGESLVDIKIVEGEPRAEKVTVPADAEPAEPDEAPAEE